MDERTAEQLAAIVGGEAWDSGGGIWLVTVNREDGRLVVFSGDSVCEYEGEEAFDEGRAATMIRLNVPEADELWVIVDAKGEIYYRDSAMERGWSNEYEAEHEAKGIQSRLGGRFSVVKKSEVA